VTLFSKHLDFRDNVHAYSAGNRVAITPST